MQREIEAKGIPTVSITVLPAETKPMRPPRALHPVGHKVGCVFGGVGEREKQMRVLVAALRQFEQLNIPGEIIELKS